MIIIINIINIHHYHYYYYQFIRAIWASPDGKKVAYGLSTYDDKNKTLSSMMMIKVRDVDSSEDSEIDTITCDDIDVFTMNWYQNHSG